MTDQAGHQHTPDAVPDGATAHHADATGPGDAEAASEAGNAVGAAEARAFRDLLRGLRVWDVELPAFDVATAPDDPLPLFRQWLREAARPVSPSPTP